jgi:hypothetical protein
MKLGNSRYLHLFFGSIVMLAGCVTASNRKNSDYGQAMTQDECQAIAAVVIADAFKDSASVRFRHRGCVQGYWRATTLLDMPLVYGWFQKGTVNGKNSLGGYTGYKEYLVIMRDHKPIRYCITDEFGACLPVGI